MFFKLSIFWLFFNFFNLYNNNNKALTYYENIQRLLHHVRKLFIVFTPSIIVTPILKYYNIVIYNVI